MISILPAYILVSVLSLGSAKFSSQEENGILVDPEPRLSGIACPAVVLSLINRRKSDFCKDIQCDGLLSENCKDGSVYVRGLTMCGCCGGCARYINEGEPCEVSPPDPSINPNCTDPFCPILMNRCTPGLECNYLGGSSKVCSVSNIRPPDSGDEDSIDKESCEYKRNLGLTNQLHWTPLCEPDGSYSQKQCKGQDHEVGVCFCVAPNGDRIFGREWRSRSQNQTCACSRHVYNLRAQGGIAAFHCSPDGNYEPLQCDMESGLCYCVDPQTGKLDGAVLPEHQWKLLPCYSTNLTNWDESARYLRICESEWVAGEQLSREARMHGLHALSVKDLNCDYDGSYAPVRRVGALSYCVPKLGALSSGIFQEINAVPMDCRCYRDSIIYEEEGRNNFIKTCSRGTGNYATTSPFIDSGDMYSCVDEDGFYYGDPVPRRFECCLLGDCTGSPDSVKAECYDENTGLGQYKSCSSWPT